MPDFDCEPNFRFFALVSVWSLQLGFILGVLCSFFSNDPDAWLLLFSGQSGMCCILCEDMESGRMRVNSAGRSISPRLRLRMANSGNSNSSSRGNNMMKSELSYKERLKNTYDTWRVILAVCVVAFMLQSVSNLLIIQFAYDRTLNLSLFYSISFTTGLLAISLFFVSLHQLVLSFHGSSFQISTNIILRYYAGLSWMLIATVLYFVCTPAVLGSYVSLIFLDILQAIISGSSVLTGIAMFIVITYQFSVRLISLVSINHKHQRQRSTLSTQQFRCNPKLTNRDTLSKSTRSQPHHHHHHHPGQPTETILSLKSSVEGPRMRPESTDGHAGTPDPPMSEVFSGTDLEMGTNGRPSSSPKNGAGHRTRLALALAGSSDNSSNGHSSDETSESKSSTDIGQDLSTTNDDETLDTTHANDMTDLDDKDLPVKAVDMRRTRSVIEEFDVTEQAFLRTVARQLVLSLWFTVALVIFLISAISWSFSFECWTPQFTMTYVLCGIGFCLLILCRFYFGEQSKQKEYDYYCWLCNGLVLDMAALCASR